MINNNAPCKWYSEGYETHGFRDGGGECIPDCDCPEDIDDPSGDCECGPTCPCYSPLATQRCEKHGTEYYDICPQCEYEMFFPEPSEEGDAR